jgi:hypothetical protein
MSILGKLLIVFNLLAAGAFAWFTLENWKLRQDLTFRALENEVRLRGLPVDPGEAPSSLDKNRVVFPIELHPGTVLESLSKKDLARLLSPGDDTFGDKSGELIANQGDELKRVQKKVIETVRAAGDNNRYGFLKTYLLNLARGGAERDGINALFDMLDPNKAKEARNDLPFLARTSSQIAALQAAVEVAKLGNIDPGTPEIVRATRVAAAREAVRQCLLGEASHGASGDEEIRKLKNAIEGKASKDEIVRLAGTGSGFDHLADALAEALADKPSQDKAVAALVAYAALKAGPPSEKAALVGIGALINPPAVGANNAGTVDQVAENLLNSKFDDAAVAAGGKTGIAIGEKARKIAHILYHIDAHRHAARDQATVDARRAWHTRVAGIVGLQEYVRAAEAQASEFTEAAQRLLSVITEEQGAFEAQYQALVQRVQFAYTQWLTLDAAFKVQDTITKDNERLKAERETERDNLRTALTAAIADTKAALERLQKDQGQLFRIQKQLRDAQAALMSLEIELRRLELVGLR